MHYKLQKNTWKERKINEIAKALTNHICFLLYCVNTTPTRRHTCIQWQYTIHNTQYTYISVYIYVFKENIYNDVKLFPNYVTEFFNLRNSQNENSKMNCTLNEYGMVHNSHLQYKNKCVLTYYVCIKDEINYHMWIN